MILSNELIWNLKWSFLSGVKNKSFLSVSPDSVLSLIQSTEENTLVIIFLSGANIRVLDISANQHKLIILMLAIIIHLIFKQEYIYG